MSYKDLGRYIGNNQLNVPDWLSQYMGEFSPTEYSGSVLDELQRRSGISGAEQMGQLASYYSGAGRSMSGMMGKAMQDAYAENMQRERGDIASYLDQAYQQHQNRGVQAAGLQAQMQNTYQQALAQGYSADQARAAAIRVAQLNLEGTKYGWDTQAGIAGADRALNERFGLMDRDYRSQMMPFEQWGTISSGLGNLLGNFGTNHQYGTTSTQGPRLNTGLSMLQGGFGGALGGAGLGSKGGGGGGGWNNATQANVGNWFNNNPQFGGWMPSDIRLKRNVMRLPFDYLPGVPVATWEWKHNGLSDIGVIAQDMQEVYPERVINVNGILHVRY